LLAIILGWRTAEWQSCGSPRVDLGCALTRVAERLVKRL
jgi:hypothetical protein